ncbi:MAG: hypothetical protein ACYC3Q_02795 [Gemmatimonadaceae bacterium]
MELTPAATKKEQRTMRRMLRMVGELHIRGYERIRICPEYFPYGDGFDWVCRFVSADDTFALHGARAARRAEVQYTSDMQRRYFGWTGVEHLTPSQLADRFIAEFPELALAGRGADWRYASWYALLLRLTFPAALPVAAHPGIDTDLWLQAEQRGEPPALIPLPPGGRVLASQSAVSEAACFVGEREVARFQDRQPATPLSFGTPLPMPPRRVRLRYSRWLPDEYFTALSLGFVPTVMEDKWFSYVRDGRLYLHRSWTGFCVYEVLFERLPSWMGGGYLALEALVNRDPEQYGTSEDLADARLLDRLVFNLCRVNARLSEV